MHSFELNCVVVILMLIILYIVIYGIPLKSNMENNPAILNQWGQPYEIPSSYVIPSPQQIPQENYDFLLGDRSL